MLKRFLLLIIVILINQSGVFSQVIENESLHTSWRDKIVLGGNFGLAVGKLTQIEISPQIGYRLTPKFIAGVGAGYRYYSDKRFSNDFQTHIIGGKTYASLSIIRSIFAHAEIEFLNLETQYFGDLSRRNPELQARFWNTATLVGGGYTQSIGGRGGISIMVLWNLNQTIESPYQNPIIRFGINF